MKLRARDGASEQELIECARNRLLKYREITSNDCWLYTGKARDKGYAIATFQGRTWRVHRLSMFLFKPEEYKKGLFVLHKNECSSRRCFNPAHLYVGDHSDNMQDLVESGNHTNASKTHCPAGHEYTEANTYLYKSMRYCRECHKKHTEEWRLFQ